MISVTQVSNLIASREISVTQVSNLIASREESQVGNSSYGEQNKQ